MPPVMDAINKITSHPTFKAMVSNPASKKAIKTQGLVGGGLLGSNYVLKHINENQRRNIVVANAANKSRQQEQSNVYNPWTDAKSLGLGIGVPSVAALLIYSALNRAAQKE